MEDSDSVELVSPGKNEEFVEVKNEEFVEVFDSVTGPSKSKKLLGGMCFCIFFTSWMVSMCYPVVVIYSFCSGFYGVALVMVLFWLFAVSYEPTKRTSIRRFFDRYMKHTHPRARVCYLGDEIKHSNCAVPQDNLLMQFLLRTGLKSSKEDRMSNNGHSPVFYAIHPHGVLTQGWSILFVMEAFDRVRFCFATILYLTPVFKLASQFITFVGPVEKESLKRFMKRKESVALIPGGWEEATIHQYSVDRLYISKRKGFIAYCIRYGYILRPIFVFGESQTYDNFTAWERFRLKLNDWNLPGAYPFGLANSPYPKRANIHIVIDKAIKLPQCDNPSEELVNKFHAAYVERLKELHNNYSKIAYGADCKALEIY